MEDSIPAITTIMQYPISKANEYDLQSLKDLLVETGLKPTIEAGSGNLYYFASDNEIKIGMIGAELSADAALIRSTAVLKTYRKIGLAGKLIEALFDELARRKIEHLYLFSKDTGPFWQKYGFIQCPVDNVIHHLPASSQVITYTKDNSIWTDVAWYRIL